jgi:hypothetical protein
MINTHFGFQMNCRYVYHRKKNEKAKNTALWMRPLHIMHTPADNIRHVQRLYVTNAEVKCTRPHHKYEYNLTNWLRKRDRIDNKTY